MFLTPVQTIIMILAVMAGTQLTRWLPFLLFPENKKPPEMVLYLGKVLPAAVHWISFRRYSPKRTSPFPIPKWMYTCASK